MPCSVTYQSRGCCVASVGESAASFRKCTVDLGCSDNGGIRLEHRCAARPWALLCWSRKSFPTSLVTWYTWYTLVHIILLTRFHFGFIFWWTCHSQYFDTQLTCRSPWIQSTNVFLIASCIIKKAVNEHPGASLAISSLSFSSTGAVKHVTLQVLPFAKQAAVFAIRNYKECCIEVTVVAL